MCFSETGRLVSGFLQARGPGVAGHAGIADGMRAIGTNAQLRRVKAEHQGIAAGDAGGRLAGRLPEDHALPGQTVEAGRLDMGIQPSQRVPALLVRHKENDVRIPAAGLGRRGFRSSSRPPRFQGCQGQVSAQPGGQAFIQELAAIDHGVCPLRIGLSADSPAAGPACLR